MIFSFTCPGQGHKYDNDPRLTWRYDQRVRVKEKDQPYAVEIRFAPTLDVASTGEGSSGA